MYKYLIFIFLFLKISPTKAYAMSQNEAIFFTKSNFKDSSKIKNYPLTIAEEKALMDSAKKVKRKSLWAAILALFSFHTLGLGLIWAFVLGRKGLKKIKEIRESTNHYPEDDEFKMEIDKILNKAYLTIAITLGLGFFAVISFAFLIAFILASIGGGGIPNDAITISWLSSLAVSMFLVLENMFFKTNNI